MRGGASRTYTHIHNPVAHLFIIIIIIVIRVRI